jgi:SepF-like predicted cell division protein (DUF552 family)
MALKDILGKHEPQEPDFVEIPEDAGKEEFKVGVKIDTLDSYADSDRVQEMLRNGNVIFLRVKDFRIKNVTDFKRTVEKLKKTVAANDGDIVGLDEDFLIVTPKFATVYRGK